MMNEMVTDYIYDRMIGKRFKDLKELKKIMDEDLQELPECDSLYIDELCYKSYYDDEFEDYEVLGTIRDKRNPEEELYDITLYFAISRIGERVIIETAMEEL